jgi:uncharacterized protein involved in type VI secretion and phage assembly
MGLAFCCSATKPKSCVTGFLTRKSHQGEGFNGSLQGNGFEDQVDNNKIYVHSPKDLETNVLNDSITHIGHNHGQQRQINIEQKGSSSKRPSKLF